MKKVNMECDLGVGFDNTIKADIHILFIVSSENDIVGWMIRNFIREASDALKIYKTLIRSHREYWTLSSRPVSRDGNPSVIFKLEAYNEEW